MNTRFFRFFFILTILTTGFIQGCCPECEKPDYGEFTLNEASINRMAFSALGTQTFVSTNGDKINLKYFTPVQGNAEGTYDCEFDNRCGICCGTYLSEFFYVQLADDDNTRRFEFALNKDFARNDPLEESDSITEILTLALNNDLIAGEVVDVANTGLDQTVTLDGRTFTKTRKFESANPPFFNDPGVIVNFYFSYNLGVVGFQYADSTIWRLEN